MAAEIKQTENNLEEKSIIEIEKKEKKFNFNTLLNIILLIGLAALYVIHFQGKRMTEKELPKPLPVLQSTSGAPTIVFINSDTIKENYLFVKEIKEKLKKRYKQMEGVIANKQAELERKEKSLQNKMELKIIDRTEAEKLYANLQIEAKELYELNDKYTNQLAEEEYNLNIQYMDSVLNYLERFNKNYNYDYILGYTRGSGILFAKDTLDITNQILDALNKEYEAKMTEKK